MWQVLSAGCRPRHSFNTGKALKGTQVTDPKQLASSFLHLSLGSWGKGWHASSQIPVPNPSMIIMQYHHHRRHHHRHHRNHHNLYASCCNLLLHEISMSTRQVMNYVAYYHQNHDYLGLASISFWSWSDRLLYCAIRVDHKQDWSRSWS